MKQVFYINFAQQYITTSPNELACSAIGSCVAVCLADREKRMIGVSRVMVPSPVEGAQDSSPARYAETAVEHLVNSMVAEGADRDRLVAKVVGGATIYPENIADPSESIGSRNTNAVLGELSRLGIEVISLDVGGDYGRSILVDAETFDIKVRSLSKQVEIV